MTMVNDIVQLRCPDGVEFRSLASIARRNQGTGITAGRMKELNIEGGAIRVFAAGNTVANVAIGSVPAANVIHQPSVIVKSRGNIGFVYYDKPFTHKNEMWSYTITDRKVDTKFVYYQLLTRSEQLQELARARSAKLPQLSVGDTDALLIPVPPLQLQREIVKVLDNFTQLEAELEQQLEAELEARRRQYDYYRIRLLTFREAG